MGSLSVKFWGTRGLISSPRPETAIFGGNTPCIQVLYKDHLILVDSGFGCANLGDELISQILAQPQTLKIHIFYTHFHWDHVQGLPFFKPIYFPTTELDLYSPVPSEAMLANLDILFDGSYSPFESLMSMQAKVKLHRLRPGSAIGGLKVDFHPVDHGEPATTADGHGTFAYQFTAPDGERLCIVTDHEARNTKINRSLVAWAQGCDLLVHDGQYLDDEYKAHVGWGHSAASAALGNALKIAPAMTLLTHHAPSRDDRQLQSLHRTLMHGKRFRALNFEFAREDIVYEVGKLMTLGKAS